jgi:leucyl aminopeptidase
MDISVRYGDALGQTTPLLVLGTWEDEALPDPVADLVEVGDWTGRLKQTLTLYPHGALPAKRVLLVGMGQRSQMSTERLREAAAVAAQRARDLRLERCLVELPTSTGLTHHASAQALVEGNLLGLYRFQRYKTERALFLHSRQNKPLTTSSDP